MCVTYYSGSMSYSLFSDVALFRLVRIEVFIGRVRVIRVARVTFFSLRFDSLQVRVGLFLRVRVAEVIVI